MKNVFDSRFDDDLNEICAVLSVLPANYAEQVMGIEELEDYFEKTDEFEGEVHVLVGCMPRGPIYPKAEPQAWNAAIFEPPTDCMKTHPKPLFIQLRIDGCIVVNKVLIDGGELVNLIPEGVMERLRKTGEDLIPHNLVITDFNGKI